MKRWIRGARIFTMGPQGTLEKGDILIENGKIAAIGEQLKMARSRQSANSWTGQETTPKLKVIDASRNGTAIPGIGGVVETRG